jgi:hypothetical protein
MASVALAGSVAQRPGRGGHAQVFLNYLSGLAHLGHEVVFLDRLTPEMVAPGAADLARSEQARWLHAVMAGAGFDDRYVLLTEDVAGEPDGHAQALERLRRADLLINVNGFLRDEELLEASAATAFLDIDPAIQQMWEALGLADSFLGHDLHFTVGENIGDDSCSVPTCDIEWIPTRPPVVMEEWEEGGSGRHFTSVASWRGPYGPIEYRGETYGLRVHEFRQLAPLASMVRADLVLALDIDPQDGADAQRLRDAGWRLVDPLEVAADPSSYRAFVRASAAEISVAKNVYVRSRCGWFSDRSACYLASGRPVIAQDTGYAGNLPVGTGLLPYSTVEEAAAAVEEVRGNWRVHSRAARALAAECFDSDLVLKEMLDAAGI